MIPVLAVYALVGLVVCRTVAGGFAYWLAFGPGDDITRREPNLLAWIVGLAVGSVAAVAWPPLLALVAVKYLPAPQLSVERHVRDRQQQQRVRALERRNQQLERELGIG